MDATATVPEIVLLLALDDASGRPVLDGSALPRAVGGAGLAELVVLGRLRLAEEGERTRAGRFVVGSAVVDPTLEAFVEHAEGRTPAAALTRVVGWGGAGSPAGRLQAELLGELVADGALEHGETRWLGITWAERWERGARTEREDAVQARARAILGGEEPGDDDERLASALAILHGAKVLPKVFPDLDAKAVGARGEALAQGSWSSRVVRDAVQAMQMAMLMATITPVITTTTSS